jgi:tetratricopeptide (TPR) repeat protein
MRIRRLFRLTFTVSAVLAPLAVSGQGTPGTPPSPRADSNRTASRLDTDGQTVKAREIFQKLLEGAADPAAKAAAQRAMAMSYAFDGDCANTVKYEEMVMAYWVTREQAEPQNAFYQEGEMANEAARVCIDAGVLDVAEKYYRKGTDIGLKEPAPKTHAVALWNFRLEHALARLAARRGDARGAAQHVAAARKALDSDSTVAAQQERFFPYLTGYVALYTGNIAGAEADLTKALAMRGNERDPFMHAMLAMTYEKQGNSAKSKETWQKAYDLSTAHNPPAAYVRPLARKKLGLP